jgi:glyoxylase-like metal-dependent hydrolase (beta-lactamase superfamily II)
MQVYKKMEEQRMTYHVSRRSLLALGAGLGAAAAMGGTALARAPKVGTQPSYFYRFNLGNAEVTVVSDGPLPLGPPKGTFVGIPDEDIKKMLTDNFLSPDNIVLEQNSPIVNMGDKLVLFDTGMGTSKAFGPTTGRQQKSMMEAGIKPEDIDAVVFTHAHIDHIGGVVDDAGRVLFPNAQFYIAQSDFDYWTDEGKMGSPLKDFVIHARKNLLPVRDRLPHQCGSAGLGIGDDRAAGRTGPKAVARRRRDDAAVGARLSSRAARRPHAGRSRWRGENRPAASGRSLVVPRARR